VIKGPNKKIEDVLEKKGKKKKTAKKKRYYHQLFVFYIFSSYFILPPFSFDSPISKTKIFSNDSPIFYWHELLQ